jgi:hypothetical protein
MKSETIFEKEKGGIERPRAKKLWQRKKIRQRIKHKPCSSKTRTRSG